MPKMSAIPVKVKHNGVVVRVTASRILSNLLAYTHTHTLVQHDVSLDPSGAATAFKEAIYQVTGVPLDRQKVMIKGGMLKVSVLIFPLLTSSLNLLLTLPLPGRQRHVQGGCPTRE